MPEKKYELVNPLDDRMILDFKMTLLQKYVSFCQFLVIFYIKCYSFFSNRINQYYLTFYICFQHLVLNLNRDFAL